MKTFTFFYAGPDIQKKVEVENLKQAHQIAWNLLTDTEKEQTRKVQLVSVEGDNGRLIR